MRLNDLEPASAVSKAPAIKKAVLLSPIENLWSDDGSVELGRNGYDHRWELKGCPRCRGDVFLDSEEGSLFGHCLQCGYVGEVVRARKPSEVPKGRQ